MSSLPQNVAIKESSEIDLEYIERLDSHLQRQFAPRMSIDPLLSRSLVSFQANKSRPVYRWYKFKEAFSAALVQYFLDKYQVVSGKVLDPFSGSGTTLFAASERGLDADGIEVLPIGREIVTARKLLQSNFTTADLTALAYWRDERPWNTSTIRRPISELRITAGAYPEQTRDAIERYLNALAQENPHVQAALRLVLLCVLETVSFTRKDGQYLRWDARSGRRQGAKPFNKGTIPEFDTEVSAKIQEIVDDVSKAGQQITLFQPDSLHGRIELVQGSCLNVMPSLPASTYDAIITSPPYCNRYDYTRTYALELALLGIDEAGLVALRQAMLSCTVENRAKDLLSMNPAWEDALGATDDQELLQAILRFLEIRNEKSELNNTGIPRMVRGYFYEMACVIHECARVLKRGAPLIMVNDNVRYAGASISVDLILSDLAGRLGFEVEQILVLPGGKGNSSQQMGTHGRSSLRKCVYVWRKRG